MFVLLLGGDKNFANQLQYKFANYLNNGYTYRDIKTEIMSAFYNNKKIFRWNFFENKTKKGDNSNILKIDTKYYHKQLKLINDLPVIERDINLGTIVSRTTEYFLEPVASYTLQDFIKYFYQTMPIDLQAQPPSYMAGILRYKVNKFGIDKVLFMTDLYAQDCKQEDKLFSLTKWDDYSSIADEYMNNIKGAFPEDEPYYTPRQRRIFDG